jgi:hypothetical protein
MIVRYFLCGLSHARQRMPPRAQPIRARSCSGCSARSSFEVATAAAAFAALAVNQFSAALRRPVTSSMVSSSISRHVSIEIAI